MTPTFPLSLAARLGTRGRACSSSTSRCWPPAPRPQDESGWWAGVGAAVLDHGRRVGALARVTAVDAGLAVACRGRSGALGVPAGALADHDRTFGAGPVGIRAVGPHLVAVVAVDGQPHSPSALAYPRVDTPSKLPLAAVAAGLRQFDVTLDGIDVVSVGARRAFKAHHPYRRMSTRARWGITRRWGNARRGW